MMVPELQDIALFSVALNLWKLNEDSSRNWEQLTEKVLESISLTYPHLPPMLKYRTVYGVTLMGSELVELSGTLHLFGNVYPGDLTSLHFNEIRWTPYFTIDRMKTLLRPTKEISLTLDYREYPAGVKESWNELSNYNPIKLEIFFGKYKYYVFLHSFCHAGRKCADFIHTNRRTSVILSPRFICENIFHFEKFYSPDANLENVFRYSVINADVASVARFYMFVPAEKRRENAVLMVNMVITELANLELKFKISKQKIVSTFLFLWHQLENFDRFEIVQNHFKQYYQFVLSFPGTDCLVKFVNWYRPTNNRKENREYLEKAVTGISRSIIDNEKSRRIFHLIYNKVEMMMSEIDILNLLETLLTVKDIDSSVLIMKTMDSEKKNKVLDVLHKIWTDLWKDTIDIETFMTFFIEVQSHTIQLVDVNNR